MADVCNVPESDVCWAWLLQVKLLRGSERWEWREEVLNFRDFERDECEEVKGKRVLVDEVVSNDDDLEDFKEKREMVLKDKVEDAIKMVIEDAKIWWEREWIAMVR